MFFVAGPIVVAASVIIVVKGAAGNKREQLAHLTKSPNMGTPPAR